MLGEKINGSVLPEIYLKPGNLSNNLLNKPSCPEAFPVPASLLKP